MDAAWDTEARVRELVRVLAGEVQVSLGLPRLDPGFVFELYEQVRDVLSRHGEIPSPRAAEALRSSLALAVYMVTVSHPLGSDVTPALLARLEEAIGRVVSEEASAGRRRLDEEGGEG